MPEAYVISTQSFADFQKSGRLNTALMRELERVRDLLGGKVALRSSATCEDGRELSMAGVFETFYLSDQPQSIAETLRAIYQQAQSPVVQDYLKMHGYQPEQVEMAVILQRLIEPDLAGVVYTDVTDQQILLQYAPGFGNRLVDGETEGSSVIYNPIEQRVTQSKNTDLANLSPATLATLAEYAGHIRAIFDGVPQDIEFAVKDGEVFILQARTLTAEVGDLNLEMSQEDILSHTREKISQIILAEKAELDSETVILSDSNFSELLPRPKEMDFGVFAYIFTGSDGVPGAIQLGRQAMGYPLASESVGYMHYVGGKPYFSIAGDAHTFYAGFPETRAEYNQTLVKEYLEQIEANPEKGEYPEMGLYLQDPTLEDLTARYGDRAPEYYQTYQEFKSRMAEHAADFMAEYLSQGATEAFIAQMESRSLAGLSLAELTRHIQDILEHLRTVSCVHFVKAARLGFYYSQRLRTLLSDELGFDADAADLMFAKLNQGLSGSEITAANLKIAEADSLDEALATGRRVVGHYSTGEMLEIRHPRLKDDGTALRQYVEGIFSAKDQYLGEFEQQQRERLNLENELKAKLEDPAEFTQVLAATQTYMALRETVKYQFVKEYDLLRDALVEVARRVGSDAEVIFSLYPREVEAFAQDPESFEALIAERQERFVKYPLLNLPPVIREADLDQLGEADSDSEVQTLELFGKLLAQGQVLAEAIIVNLEDFTTVEAAREVLLFYRGQALPIVLVASQMNLSHDPLIVQADGLVIENAGLVSHGAQRARELGRGAIGGIKARSLKTGERVSFDPSLKKIVRKE